MQFGFQPGEGNKPAPRTTDSKQQFEMDPDKNKIIIKAIISVAFVRVRRILFAF